MGLVKALRGSCRVKLECLVGVKGVLCVFRRVIMDVLMGLWLIGILTLKYVAIASMVVPFCGSYVESYKVFPKKELLRSLWVAIWKPIQGRS